MSTCYICGEDLLQSLKPFKPVQVVGCNQCLNISQITWEGDQPTATPIEAFGTLGNLAPRGSVMEGVLKLIPEAIPLLS